MSAAEQLLTAWGLSYVLVAVVVLVCWLAGKLRLRWQIRQEVRRAARIWELMHRYGVDIEEAMRWEEADARRRRISAGRA